MQVVVHPGLRRTLGRYSRRIRQIELSAAVLSPKALTDVLTHEAAHAALAEDATKPVRPHGPAWRKLMAQAGIADAKATRWCRRAKRETVGARAAATATQRTQSQPSARTRRTKPQPKAATTYDHWCPVCQASRPAKKPVRAWRCAACVAAGLEGRLEITARARIRQEPQATKPQVRTHSHDHATA
jgi:predicted SprT family Zn-dependent metalloprotease